MSSTPPISTRDKLVNAIGTASPKSDRKVFSGPWHEKRTTDFYLQHSR